MIHSCTGELEKTFLNQFFILSIFSFIYLNHMFVFSSCSAWPNIPEVQNKFSAQFIFRPAEGEIVHKLIQIICSMKSISNTCLIALLFHPTLFYLIYIIFLSLSRKCFWDMAILENIDTTVYWQSKLFWPNDNLIFTF